MPFEFDLIIITNNNNNNNHDDIAVCHHDRGHCESLLRSYGEATWAVSLPVVGSYRLQPPSPCIMYARP